MKTPKFLGLKLNRADRNIVTGFYWKLWSFFFILGRLRYSLARISIWKPVFSFFFFRVKWRLPRPIKKLLMNSCMWALSDLEKFEAPRTFNRTKPFSFIGYFCRLRIFCSINSQINWIFEIRKWCIQIFVYKFLNIKNCWESELRDSNLFVVTHWNRFMSRQLVNRTGLTQN